MQHRIQKALPSLPAPLSPNRRTEGQGHRKGRNEAAGPAPRPYKRDSPAYLGLKRSWAKCCSVSLSIAHSSALQDKSVTHKSAGTGIWQQAR